MTLKVLIVDKNPADRQRLSEVVRHSFDGIPAIHEVGDLQSARHRLGMENPPSTIDGHVPYDLILVDQTLPDGNATDLVSELAAYPATKVVAGSHADDAVIFPALKQGADGYLLNDDQFDVLVHEMRNISTGQPALSPAISKRLLTFLRTHMGLADAFSDLPGTSTPVRSTSNGSLPVTHPIEEMLDCERLTPRETEVLTYMSKGFTIKEIAHLMCIRWFTVNDHIKSIYKKLNVSSRAEAAVLATKYGLV